MTGARLFGGLDLGDYGLILADPPWLYKTRSKKGESKSPQAHYPCMDWHEIAALNVEALADDDCWLLLWATAPLLPEAISVLRCWGFVYKSHVVWAKKFASGKTARGLGYVARSAHEILLIGAKGRPKCARPFDSVIEGVRREHSRKPEEFFGAIDAFAPNARKCELFARARRPGWDGWGNEIDRFSGDLRRAS